MKLIDKAIELLRDEGWIRGAAHSPEGFCLMGALDEASRRVYLHQSYDTAPVGLTLPHSVRWRYELAAASLAKVIRRVTGRSYSVPEFNDTRCKNIDEAIEMLKLASEEADLSGIDPEKDTYETFGDKMRQRFSL
jgi:hypothetical protein